MQQQRRDDGRQYADIRQVSLRLGNPNTAVGISAGNNNVNQEIKSTAAATDAEKKQTSADEVAAAAKGAEETTTTTNNEQQSAETAESPAEQNQTRSKPPQQQFYDGNFDGEAWYCAGGNVIRASVSGPMQCRSGINSRLYRQGDVSIAVTYATAVGIVAGGAGGGGVHGVPISSSAAALSSFSSSSSVVPSSTAASSSSSSASAATAFSSLPCLSAGGTQKKVADERRRLTGRHAEAEVLEVLHAAIHSAIVPESIPPHSTLCIHLHVLSQDGCLPGHCVNAAMAALLHHGNPRGIRLRGSLTAVTVALVVAGSGEGGAATTIASAADADAAAAVLGGNAITSSDNKKSLQVLVDPTDREMLQCQSTNTIIASSTVVRLHTATSSSAKSTSKAAFTRYTKHHQSAESGSSLVSHNADDDDDDDCANMALIKTAAMDCGRGILQLYRDALGY